MVTVTPQTVVYLSVFSSVVNLSLLWTFRLLLQSRKKNCCLPLRYSFKCIAGNIFPGVIMEGAHKGKRKEKEMSAFSKAYLVLYNGAQTAGWSYLLFKTVKFLLEKQSVIGLWQECCTTVTIFQTLACLEVLHCIVGLVPSSALVTFMQVFSRVFMVWGVLIPVEEAQNSPSLAVTFIAWGITEVVRYSYYAANLIGASPKFLTWCRYSLFLGLYPMGVAGELGNILYALNPIFKRKLFFLSLPNAFNISFNFYYACIGLMVTYIPIFPELFNHMRRQRKKILGGGSEGRVGKKVQ